VNTREQMAWPEQIRDREQFTALYREHHPAIFRFALSMTGDRWVAMEVTQDVFVWLIHHPERFDPSRGELGAFLLGVARKYLLRRGKDAGRLVPFDPQAHSKAVPAREFQPDAEGLRKAIAALPPHYRELVVMCDLEGLSYEQAAEATGSVIGTVRSRLHRARQFLAKKLEGCAV
jgi:RNA polymerase sigma-70 factor (ECF subfamily)